MLPSRVIDMGSLRSPQLSLSVGEDRRGSFATLSYCWGKFAERPHYVTTRANITDRMECIDPSILPKTFSDTIFLCRILGIRFLWIDSICIIQGDIDDWKEQSKKMGNIYAQALLNISAAVGIDSNSGLFVSRDPRKTYPCPFTCRYTDKNGSDITALFLSCLELDANKFSHLDTRGWTFQEMYLPLRTLRFSASGMYWTCTSLNASEALPTGLRPFNHKSDFDRYINRGPEVFGPGHTNISQKYAWWYRAIERYSRRQLTKESDRLEALCGLASVFELGLDDKYLFGIWKADIVRGLAWRVHGKFNDNSERSTQNNSLTQIVPSWSWASRPSKAIIYLSQGLELDANPEIERSLDVEETLPQPRPCFELLSWDCIPPCELRIRGLLLRARHSRKYNSGVFTVLRPDDCSTFWGRPAYDELVDEDDDLYCLPISVDITATAEENYAKLSREELGLVTNEELISEQKELLKYGLIWSGLTWCGDEAPNLKLDRSNRFNCLILRKVDAQEMKFRRVGYVEILDGHCFEGVIPTILYIE